MKKEKAKHLPIYLLEGEGTEGLLHIRFKTTSDEHRIQLFKFICKACDYYDDLKETLELIMFEMKQEFGTGDEFGHSGCYDMQPYKLASEALERIKKKKGD